jgi:hypothetical protein
MDKKNLQHNDILEFTNDIFAEIEHLTYNFEKKLIKRTK